MDTFIVLQVNPIQQLLQLQLDIAVKMLLLAHTWLIHIHAQILMLTQHMLNMFAPTQLHNVELEQLLSLLLLMVLHL